MIERTHPKLSVGTQCRLLSISRSSFYYEPQGETAMNLDLMLLIDKQFLETPFYGVRQMTWHLQNEGRAVNEKRIRRLMRLMRVRRENSPPDCFLTLLTAHAQGRSAWPRTGGGSCLTLSGGHHGLVHPQGAGLAHLEHAGNRLLPRGIERGHPHVRAARDHEYGAWSRHWFERPCDARAASSRLSIGPTG